MEILSDTKKVLSTIKNIFSDSNRAPGTIKSSKFTTLNLLDDPYLPINHMKDILKTKAPAKYQKNSPFPHIVFDNFFSPKVLNKVLTEHKKNPYWYSCKKRTEIKSSLSDVSQIPPYTRYFLHALNSGTFIKFLEKLTGIEGLIPDPHIRGGGLHCTRRGGKLGIHRDFNYFEKLKLYRRINIIIFLNHNWEESWGGHLELWDKDLTKNEIKVAPIFNRMALFSTSNISYHGHPHPLECPEGENRKSLALYYYTSDYPYEDDKEPHSTIFKET